MSTAKGQEHPTREGKGCVLVIVVVVIDNDACQ